MITAAGKAEPERLCTSVPLKVFVDCVNTSMLASMITHSGTYFTSKILAVRRQGLRKVKGLDVIWCSLHRAQKAFGPAECSSQRVRDESRTGGLRLGSLGFCTS